MDGFRILNKRQFNAFLGIFTIINEVKVQKPSILICLNQKTQKVIIKTQF